MEGSGDHSWGNLKSESYPVWSDLGRRSRKAFLGHTRTVLWEYDISGLSQSHSVWDTPGLLQLR